MTPKQFLMQAWMIDQRIEAKIDERERLRGRLEAGRSANYSGMPRGGSGDWTDGIDAVIELEKAIGREIEKLCKVKRDVNDAIDAVEDIKYRVILEMRYRAYMNWDEIVEKTGYQLRSLTRIHGKALLMIQIPSEYCENDIQRQQIHIKRKKE